MNNPKIQALLAKVNALSMREKLIVIVTLTLIIYALWDTALMQPLSKKRAQLQELLTPKQVRNTQLAAQIQQAVMASQHDPNADLRARQKTLEREVELLNERLKERTVDLIAPEEMTQVLQQMLSNGMQVISLQSEKPKPIVEEQKEDKVLSFFGEEAKAPNIYRHTLELTLRASYLDTLRYLRKVEALPWLFSWEHIELEVESYPTCRVTLRAHTLSLSEAWIGG